MRGPRRTDDAGCIEEARIGFARRSRLPIPRVSGSLNAATGRRTWTIPTLSPAMIPQSRVIAKGRRIRDVERLVATYGGRVSGWTKKSSPRLEDNEGTYELHWYEHSGIGRVEVKRKQVSEL